VFDRAAETYDVVAGAYHEHFGARLVERAGIGPGDAVLDVACGRGAVLVPALAATGPAGKVVGVDLSPEMIRLARDRVGDRAELLVMDAEHLDVPDGSVDAVLSGFGIFFLPDPEAAVAGFRRVLRAGGTVALSTWGAEDERWAWEDDLLADVEVARRAVQRPLDDPAELADLLAGAGFQEVEVAPIEHVVQLADVDEWWTWKWSYSLRGLLEQLPPDRVARLRRDADAHLTRLRDEPEGLRLRLQALLATARAPVTRTD
jgi:ubiquinone/menaquinone biosynthesis C-methylase UbiE